MAQALLFKYPNILVLLREAFARVCFDKFLLGEGPLWRMAFPFTNL